MPIKERSYVVTGESEDLNIDSGNITDTDKPSPISETAIIPAYGRSLSDIPYAFEAYASLQVLAPDVVAKVERQGLLTAELAPQFEAYYKIVQRLLEESGVDQVLELASGYTMRGLDIASQSPKTYVELDLPDVMQQKQNLIRHMGVSAPANLHLVSGDVTDDADMERALRHLDPAKPVAIINEGLMRYLDFPGKTKLAKTIHGVLERQGGVWINPDISLMQGVAQEDEIATNFSTSLSALSGVNTTGNLFSSTNHATKFFQGLGFSVEPHGLMEVSNRLTSPQKAGISKEAVDKVCKPLVAFVMRPSVKK